MNSLARMFVLCALCSSAVSFATPPLEKESLSSTTKFSTLTDVQRRSYETRRLHGLLEVLVRVGNVSEAEKTLAQLRSPTRSRTGGASSHCTKKTSRAPSWRSPSAQRRPMLAGSASLRRKTPRANASWR